jgi:hypothetical protein
VIARAKPVSEKSPSGKQAIKEEEVEPPIVVEDHGVMRMVVVWETWLFMCITYNFFTACYFFGMPGFPTDAWIYLEFLSEISMIVDLFIRYFVRR